MSNTYTKIHLHLVFAVKYRQALINRAWQHELYKYITGIIQRQGHKVLAINGVPDHIHILAGVRPNQSVSDLMQDVKGDSSKWINQKNLVRGRFSWQSGYGAFSCSVRELDPLIDYIKNQEAHHAKKGFIEEYREHLEKAGIAYDERFIFCDPE